MWRLFHFILSHSIFISFCAVALSLQTLLLLNIPVNAILLAFIFFATLSGYNAYWMISRFSFNNPASRISFLKNNKSSLSIMFAAVTGMVICSIHLHLVMYNIIATLILLGLYALPLFSPFKNFSFIRRAGFLKTVLLAFSWAQVTTMIPLQRSVFDIHQAGVLIFFSRFLFMLLLCIIFDKRDAAIDKIRGLHSLATGISNLLLHSIVVIIFIIYVITVYMLRYHGIGLPDLYALVAAGTVTLLMYFTSLKKRGYIFYYFIVDGMMFLSGLLTILADIYPAKQ